MSTVPNSFVQLKSFSSICTVYFTLGQNGQVQICSRNEHDAVAILRILLLHIYSTQTKAWRAFICCPRPLAISQEVDGGSPIQRRCKAIHQWHHLEVGIFKRIRQRTRHKQCFSPNDPRAVGHPPNSSHLLLPLCRTHHLSSTLRICRPCTYLLPRNGARKVMQARTRHAYECSTLPTQVCSSQIPCRCARHCWYFDVHGIRRGRTEETRGWRFFSRLKSHRPDLLTGQPSN